MNRIKEIFKRERYNPTRIGWQIRCYKNFCSKTLAGNPSQETLEKIANALNVPMWQLFASPNEVQQTGNSLVCPNCGTPLELKIKE